MNRSATASQSLGNPERKNTPCFSDLAGVKFLLKMERVFFFRGSALDDSGSGAGRNAVLGRRGRRRLGEEFRAVLALIFCAATQSKNPVVLSGYQ